MTRRVRDTWNVGAVLTLAVAVSTVSGCTGVAASSDPCARGSQSTSGAQPSEAELRAAMDRVADRVDEVPGVGASSIDTTNGRVVVEVASGDDNGAGTCAVLADILDESDVPYRLRVFEAPTESTIRTTVPVTVAWAGEDPSLRVEVASCNGLPEATALEETSDHVRLEITATVTQAGWPSQACVDTLAVPLEAPLGERTLTDLTTGEEVVMHGRTSE